MSETACELPPWAEDLFEVTFHEPVLVALSCWTPPAPSNRRRQSPSHEPVAQETEADLAMARQLVGGIFLATIEALQGRRPLAQLSSWLSPDAQATLDAWRRARRWQHARLASVRVCIPHDRSIEGCARVQLGARSIAAALRMERRGSRWYGTRLELLAPGSELRS